MKSGSIPVTILTGFLGSGKTSLLNRLLTNPILDRTMVLVNEFGEIGIDHLLLEHVDNTMIELSNGCLCCTVRGDLVDRLSDLLSRIAQGSLKKISRLVIETTGLADPIPILQLFMTHPLFLHGYHHSGMITVVDAVNGIKTLSQYEEARRQIALADRIIISKSDLATESHSALSSLLSRLGSLNKTAEIFIPQPEQKIDVSLLQCDVKGLDHAATKTFPELHDHHHGPHDHDKNRHSDSIHSFCLTHDRPLPMTIMEVFLDHLCVQYGASILRLKAIVETLEKPDQPLVLHGVQGFFHLPQWLPGWAGQTRRTRLVVIADGISSADIEALFGSFTGRIGVDRADFQALIENPLAISGLKF